MNQNKPQKKIPPYSFFMHISEFEDVFQENSNHYNPSKLASSGTFKLNQTSNITLNSNGMNNNNLNKSFSDNMQMKSKFKNNQNFHQKQIGRKYVKDIKFSSQANKGIKKKRKKRARKNPLETRNTPEKYPQDYAEIDSSSSNENSEKIESKILQNNNSFFMNNIENGNIIYNSQKESKNEQMKEFDIRIQISQIGTQFSNKQYFKNIKATIKIIYYKEEKDQMKAIFIFKDSNKEEKKLFAGVYNAQKFNQFCKVMYEKKTFAEVELRMDIVELANYLDLEFEANPDLFLDIYFLVNIIKI